MRPSQKTNEERKWVLNTINKYFDVIVEDEDEDEEEDDEDSDIEEEDSEDESLGSSDSLSAYEDAVEAAAGFQSSSRMRSMLMKAATNVSSSQSNLAGLNLLKQKLGSRISLGFKESSENLSSL
jgi:hypothetical protein